MCWYKLLLSLKYLMLIVFNSLFLCQPVFKSNSETYVCLCVSFSLSVVQLPRWLLILYGLPNFYSEVIDFFPFNLPYCILSNLIMWILLMCQWCFWDRFLMICCLLFVIMSLITVNPDQNSDCSVNPLQTGSLHFNQLSYSGATGKLSPAVPCSPFSRGLWDLCCRLCGG